MATKKTTAGKLLYDTAKASSAKKKKAEEKTPLDGVKHGMRIYLSGPIGEDGVTDSVKESFAAAEAALSQKGCIVINPTSIAYQGMLRRGLENRKMYGTQWKGSDYSYYLAKDIEMIGVCDAVLMLTGWRKSKGAKAEYAYAKAIGLRVFNDGGKEQ